VDSEYVVLKGATFHDLMDLLGVYSEDVLGGEYHHGVQNLNRTLGSDERLYVMVRCNDDGSFNLEVSREGLSACPEVAVRHGIIDV